MKKVFLLAGLLVTLTVATMAQTAPKKQDKPKKEMTKKDSTSKPMHMKAPKKAADSTHKKH